MKDRKRKLRWQRQWAGWTRRRSNAAQLKQPFDWQQAKHRKRQPREKIRFGFLPMSNDRSVCRYFLPDNLAAVQCGDIARCREALREGMREGTGQDGAVYDNAHFCIEEQRARIEIE